MNMNWKKKLLNVSKLFLGMNTASSGGIMELGCVGSCCIACCTVNGHLCECIICCPVRCCKCVNRCCNSCCMPHCTKMDKWAWWAAWYQLAPEMVSGIASLFIAKNLGHIQNWHGLINEDGNETISQAAIVAVGTAAAYNLTVLVTQCRIISKMDFKTLAARGTIVTLARILYASDLMYSDEFATMTSAIILLSAVSFFAYYADFLVIYNAQPLSKKPSAKFLNKLKEKWTQLDWISKMHVAMSQNIYISSFISAFLAVMAEIGGWAGSFVGAQYMRIDPLDMIPFIQKVPNIQSILVVTGCNFLGYATAYTFTQALILKFNGASLRSVLCMRFLLFIARAGALICIPILDNIHYIEALQASIIEGIEGILDAFGAANIKNGINLTKSDIQTPESTAVIDASAPIQAQMLGAALQTPDPSGNHNPEINILRIHARHAHQEILDEIKQQHLPLPPSAV